MNLGRETIDKLKEHGKTIHDVQFVAGINWNTRTTYWQSWDDFLKEAISINYDDGYGSAEIDPALVVVGDDWWLERAEYDGAEWWEFKTQPKKEDYKEYKGWQKDTRYKA